jgi:hypothetical protein
LRCYFVTYGTYCYRIKSIVLLDFNCAIYSRRAKVMLCGREAKTNRNAEELVGD